MNLEKWDILNKLQQGEGIDQTDEVFTKPFVENLMLPWVPPAQYPKLLDIGCGFGYELKRFREHGWQAIGIDHADGNIKHGKEKFGIDIIKMDFHDLQFPPESFDAAVTRQVFEHSYAPWLFACEIWVVLRRGGRWVVNLPSPQNKDMWGMTHPNLLYKTQMRNLFDKVGFKIVLAKEGGGSTLEFNGGGEPFDYIVEKMEGYPDNYQHVLRALEELHRRNYVGR